MKAVYVAEPWYLGSNTNKSGKYPAIYREPKKIKKDSSSPCALFIFLLVFFTLLLTAAFFVFIWIIKNDGTFSKIHGK